MNLKDPFHPCIDCVVVFQEIHIPGLFQCNKYTREENIYHIFTFHFIRSKFYSFSCFHFYFFFTCFVHDCWCYLQDVHSSHTYVHSSSLMPCNAVTGVIFHCVFSPPLNRFSFKALYGSGAFHSIRHKIIFELSLSCRLVLVIWYRYDPFSLLTHSQLCISVLFSIWMIWSIWFWIPLRLWMNRKLFANNIVLVFT